MNYIDALGYTAATLTTISFAPQALNTFRTKDVSGISLGMYSLFTFGVFLWLVYGILSKQWPLVAANCITLLFASLILGMKIKYNK